MAESHGEKRIPRNYDETMNPKNPPSSMVSRSTRSLAFWSYFGGIVALFVIIGIGYVYWKHRSATAAHTVNPTYAVGTTGTTGTPTGSDHGYQYGYEPGSTPGGSDPQNMVGHRDRTGYELHRRGADGFAQGPNEPLAQPQQDQTSNRNPLTRLDAVLQRPQAVKGLPVDIRNVTVDSAVGHTFWVRDQDMKVEVVGPDSSPTLEAGMRVHIVGTVEEGPNNRARIRASDVEVMRR
jgi:hypothetical protein